MLIPGDWIEVWVVCLFKLAADMVRDDVREFVYDVDGPTFDMDE
jgi:hypothetical protein